VNLVDFANCGTIQAAGSMTASVTTTDIPATTNHGQAARSRRMP
jgi:hypothetical protein